MAEFVVGDVVAIPFPFSDLSGKKLRPALILAMSDDKDLILCQITSKAKASPWSHMIDKIDFESGDLPVKSFVRLNKLFTAEKTIIQKKRGTLNKILLQKLLKTTQQLFTKTP